MNPETHYRCEFCNKVFADRKNGDEHEAKCRKKAQKVCNHRWVVRRHETQIVKEGRHGDGQTVQVLRHVCCRCELEDGVAIVPGDEYDWLETVYDIIAKHAPELVLEGWEGP